jgi:GT2 family glycosyltransferase
MHSFPVVTLVVVNYNARDYLVRMLSSAISSAGDVPLEIVVVDNGSTDGSAEAAALYFPDARVVISQENKGFAWGNNRGASLAGGKLLLFANNDVVFVDRCIQEMASFLSRHPEVAAVGPKVINPDGTLQFSGKRVPDVATGVMVATGLHRWLGWRRLWEAYYLLPDDYDDVQEVDHLTGCCLMVRREVWERVGGFDEDYFMYFEDIDWCLRARRSGERLVYLPSASLVHYKSVSSNKRTLATIRDYHRSARRFYDRHYAPITPSLVNWMVRLGIYTRLGLHLVLALLRLQSRVSY